MRLDNPLMAGQIPDYDRQVRHLLDAGRFDDARAAFEDVVSDVPNHVEDSLDRAVVLVHRSQLAWRLGRVPLALELAAEGWTDLDMDQPEGVAAAQTISMLGYLLDAIGHRAAALDLMALSVQVARDSEDADTIAHCLHREADAFLLRAAAQPQDGADDFAHAHSLYDEALSLTGVGQVQRGVLAGSARALAGVGRVNDAQCRAQHALALSKAASDWSSASVAMWVLATIRWEQGELESARTFASRALDAAEKIRNPTLMLRFSLDLSEICAQLGDSVGESAALRRTVQASSTVVETLQEGLGQALEQRRVAVQAQRLAAAAQEAAARDPLTGLTNRLGLELRAPALLEQTAAQGRMPWLVLVDVDWFKDVNDDAGHAAGDVTLQELASLLRRECRSDDLICRWAGDEFVVLLVDAAEQSKDAGPVVAERIRAAVNAHDWPLVLGGRTRQIPTVSIGVAAGPAKLEHLFAAADIALYRAKRAGRNRVEIDGRKSESEQRSAP